MKIYKYILSAEGKEQIDISRGVIKAILKMLVPPEYKKSLMHNMIWKISGANYKDKTRYCSAEAIKDNEKAQHDHVFTIDSIKKRFLKYINDKDEFDRTVNLIIGCSVTKTEHKKLTKLGYTKIIGWERYKKAGIKVLDMSCEPPKECDIDFLINTYKY